MFATHCVTRGLLALLIVFSARAAELKPQTLAAWNSYLKQQTANVEKHASGDHTFLWVDEDPNRMSEIRSGAVLVEPFDEHTPLRVDGGLIHHWIGAAFIPNASDDDVMAISRDYLHYKDYYKPAVEDAFPVSSKENQDEFSILFSNNSVLSRTSLKGDYRCDYIRLDDRRWYSVSNTKQMQEIKDFGQPNEKRLPDGRGSGYIWRMFSTSRIEQRDGGVIVEIEAIALSRDVPGSLHWLVDPIIRRISRSSLEKSLTETAEAVRAHNGNLALNSR